MHVVFKQSLSCMFSEFIIDDNFRGCPYCTSGKDVYILTTDTLNRGSGMVGLITWFNPPKPGPQSRALSDAVCTLSIAIVLY